MWLCSGWRPSVIQFTLGSDLFFVFWRCFRSHPSAGSTPSILPLCGLNWIVCWPCLKGVLVSLWADGLVFKWKKGEKKPTWGHRNYCSQAAKLALTDFILGFGNKLLQLLKKDAIIKRNMSMWTDVMFRVKSNRFVHIHAPQQHFGGMTWQMWPANVLMTKGVLKEARTWSTDVWLHCASACL